MTNNDGYTAGDLSPLIVVAETAYGITPETGWFFGLESVTVKQKDMIDQYQARWGGDRSINAKAMVSRGLDAGFEIDFDIPGLADWVSPVFTSLLGSSNGTTKTGDLPSFSAVVEVADNDILYNGCKVDTMKMSCAKPRDVVRCNASIISSYRSPVNSGVVTGLQSLTLTLPDVSTRTIDAPVQWVKAMVLDGTTIYPQSFTINISNGLSDGRERGVMVGADSEYYYGTRTIRGGGRTIGVDLSMFFKDWSYLATQLSNPLIETLVVELGANTFTFSNGRYKVDGNNWADLAQEQMMLNLNITFESVAIT